MKKIYIYTFSAILSLVLFAASNSFAQNNIAVSGVPANICANESLIINYVANGFTPGAGNIYQAQLSSVTGDFTVPIPISNETFSSALSGTINVTIPASTTLNPTSAYRIRIVSSDPVVIGTDNAANIIINCTTNDYYWVGGAGDWTDFDNHWATGTGGTTFYGQVPTDDDNINFDGNSFPDGGILNVDMPANGNNMTWTDVSTGPQLYCPPNYNITLRGNLIMADGVYRDVYYFYLTSDKENIIVNMADNTMKLNSNIYWDGRLTFSGSGSWILADSLHVDYLRLSSNTTLTTKSYPIDLLSTLNNYGTFNAGNSNITLQRISQNSILNAENSTFIFNKGDGWIGGTGVYNKVILEAGQFDLYNNTIDDLKLMPGVKLEIGDGSTLTVTSNFEALGSRAKMIAIQSVSSGSAGILDLGSSVALVNFLILHDTTVNASSMPVFASNSINNGNNTNWNIGGIASLPYYWIDGSGNWSDAIHWATTDGGSTLRTEPPGPADNVNFTTNSFPNGGKITIDMVANCHDMIWTDGSTNPIIQTIKDYPLTVRGNFQLATGVSRDIYDLRFESTTSNVVTFADNKLYTNGDITFDGSGSWSLQDSISCRTLWVNSGNLITNNHTLNISNIIFNNGMTTLGSSTVNTQQIQGGQAYLNTGTSNIYISEGNIYGPFNFNNVYLEGKNIRVVGNNTFNNLTLAAGAEVVFYDNDIQTFNQSLTISGTRANMVKINSINAGLETFLVNGGSAVSVVNYAQIQD
ncbi:MAG: hypothetical protein DRI71_01785, partial [Bacteroidetes bacterium]